MSQPSRGALVWAFAAVYLCWGATFLAIRHAVAEIPPLLMIALRCTGGAALLYAWLLARGALERSTARQWATAGIAGALLFLGCHGVLAWAERRVPSGQAALLMTAIPLWLVVLNAVHVKRAPAPNVMAGLVAGGLGVGVLAGRAGSWAGPLTDRLALVLGSLAWAAGSLIARHGARPRSSVQATAQQLAAGALVTLVASAVLGEPGEWRIEQVTARGLAALGFLIVGGTALGFAAYTWLLQVTTPAAVGTYGFVNPIIAVALAWLAGDEPPAGSTVVAAALVLAAVALTLLPGDPREPAARPRAAPAAARQA